LLAFAPLLEGRQGPDAQAHVEEAGTTLHHAHNDADCAACTARGLLSSANPESQGNIAFSADPSVVPATVSISTDPVWARDSRSRAPPA
jgi:hypothetical protein